MTSLNLFFSSDQKKNHFCLNHFLICLLLFLIFPYYLQSHIYSEPTAVGNHLQPITLTTSHSGITGIDCIYVINLDRRPEKWDRVNSLFIKNSMEGNRVSAVDGWNLTEEDQLELAGSYPVRMLGGEVGCLLSHVSVIKDAYERGFNAVWIFEDDIEFSENPHQISQLINKLIFFDSSWDILYTDIDSKNSFGKTIKALASDFRPDRSVEMPLAYYLFRARISTDFDILRQRYGLYSYIVSRKGMKKIYDYFTHVNLWTAIDIDIHYIPTIKQYSTVRDIVSIWCHSPFSDTKQN